MLCGKSIWIPTSLWLDPSHPQGMTDNKKVKKQHGQSYSHDLYQVNRYHRAQHKQQTATGQLYQKDLPPILKSKEGTPIATSLAPAPSRRKATTTYSIMSMNNIAGGLQWLQEKHQNCTPKPAESEQSTSDHTQSLLCPWKISSHNSRNALRAARWNVWHCGSQTHTADSSLLDFTITDPRFSHRPPVVDRVLRGIWTESRKNVNKSCQKLPIPKHTIQFHAWPKALIKIHLLVTTEERGVRSFIHALRYACTPAVKMTQTLNPGAHCSTDILAETTIMNWEFTKRHSNYPNASYVNIPILLGYFTPGRRMANQQVTN